MSAKSLDDSADKQSPPETVESENDAVPGGDGLKEPESGEKRNPNEPSEKDPEPAPKVPESDPSDREPTNPEAPEPTEDPEKTNSKVSSASDGDSSNTPAAPGLPGLPGLPPGGNGGDKDIVEQTVDPDSGLYPPLLAIPMKDRPPLPGRPFAINLTDPSVIRSITTILEKREPYFLLFHVRDPNEADTDVIRGKDSVYGIGVHCQVLRHIGGGHGAFTVLAYPLNRCRMHELSLPENRKKDKNGVFTAESSFLSDLNVSLATVKPVVDEPYEALSPDIRSLVESVKALFGKLGAKSPLEKLLIKEGTDLVKDPSKLADYVASTIHASPKQIQEILETLNVQNRLAQAVELLKVELQASAIKETTIHNLSSRADDNQTKLFIKEFIKELQKRAGLLELEDKKGHKFDERLKHLKMTDEAMEAYKLERAKMENQYEHSSEVGVSERYLDWLTSVPWGIYSKDQFNIKRAREILERDHYGLKDVKDRILEFISIGKVSGKVDGKILCLAGPPGTGKTSIARSIAEALDRSYVRIAMGGIQDVHEVKGHRRTYVGSIPGRIIHALKQAKTSNPLMLIDEIDKLDLSRGGGASSAFLEILDPEQNNAFVDNYLDVKVDLSKVLFVCTANYLGNIPPPLRDRMEIIDVSGYTNNEKIEIAKRHLIPEAAKKAGLEEAHVTIPTETIGRLIEKYCRESGLRNVKKLINRIYSKASMKIVEDIELREEAEKTANESEKEVTGEVSAGETASKVAEQKDGESAKTSNINHENLADATVTEFSDAVAADEAKENPEAVTDESLPERVPIPDDIVITVSTDNLKDFVGPEVYTRDRIYDNPPPGVATGLSYSSSGNGDALYIESILTHSLASGSGSAGMHVTGSLKDVMKESASIAYSFAKLFMSRKYPGNRFFEAADIHVHCPDGAIPKDGPSAGISFTSSLISLAINKPLPPDVAMTGEITVTGRVLAVGGLREKLLGAKRYGCTKVIFPKDIENVLEEIPDEVKEGVELIPVEWYQEVFDRIFPDVSADEVSNVWKEDFAALDQKKKSKKK